MVVSLGLDAAAAEPERPLQVTEAGYFAAGWQSVQPAQSNGRRTLLTGAAIGIFITGVPSAMVAASAGGVIAKDEAQVLFIVGIIWAIAVAVAAFAYPVSYYRRKETRHSLDRTPGP